jgi:RNA polymerase sigma factor (sigma-70 family)
MGQCCFNGSRIPDSEVLCTLSLYSARLCRVPAALPSSCLELLRQAEMFVGNFERDAILEELRSSQSREAWAEFLRQYSPLIFQTCQFSTSDADQAADCFLFACEQLSRNGFRRLLRFRPQGAASFSTWLRVVVRNLCLDWRRKQFGRPRLLRSIARLPRLEAQVYRCRYEQGLSLDETFLALCPSFPGLSMRRLMEMEAHVHESLSPRQLWLISTRKARAASASALSNVSFGEEGEARVTGPAEPRPSPESTFARQEQEQQLRLAVAKLSDQERLLIRLRFEQGLSLERIASLTGLGGAQCVHRHITNILAILRKKVT